MRKIKKIALGTTLLLAGTTALSGCGKENKNVSTQNVTKESISTTVEEINTTQEETIVSTSVAQESYNENKEFYSYIGLELDDVVKVEKFLNDDIETMTDDEIIETSTNIRKILYSDQLQSSIRITNEGIEIEEKVIQAPSLVPFVSNPEIKEELTKYESIRNKIQNETNSGSISDSTKQELIDFAMDTHFTSYENDYKIYSEEDSLGQCYIQNEWREQLYNLTTVTTNQSEISNDKYGFAIQIAPITVEESDDLNLYIQYGNDLPDDKKVEVLQTLNKMVWYQFSKNNTNILNKMISQPEISTECTLESSNSELIKSYKTKKELLLALYSNNNNCEYKYTI